MVDPKEESVYGLYRSRWAAHQDKLVVWRLRVAVGNVYDPVLPWLFAIIYQHIVAGRMADKF